MRGILSLSAGMLCALFLIGCTAPAEDTTVQENLSPEQEQQLNDPAAPSDSMDLPSGEGDATPAESDG